MHKAPGQSHSRTSPAIQVTCFSDAGSFPLPTVAFHLASIIHLYFFRWGREFCVADTLPLLCFFSYCCFLLVLFYLCLSILSFGTYCYECLCMQDIPKKVRTYGLGHTYVGKFIFHRLYLEGSEI